jgi:predicted transcriptional regulator
VKRRRSPPGELGMAILAILWERGPSTAAQVHERLARRRLSYSTVLTVLRRLEEKGELARSKVSRSHVYQAKVDPRTLQRRSLKEIVARFFGSPGALATYLIEDEHLGEDDLRRLEELLRERRGRAR